MIKKWIAVIIAVLLSGLAYMAVILLTERIFWGASPSFGREQRAALAIRDNVSPFEKWGSKAFTWPYLEKYYDSAWYFTESDLEDPKQEFLARLNDALLRYQEVDLFLLAHGNHIYTWIETLPAERRKHIRLVYNTGCQDLDQGPRWLYLGAQVYIGHPGDSASPIFYFYFLRRWTRGYTVRAATEEANGLMQSFLMRLEPLSFGELQAMQVYQGSKASYFGDGELRLQEGSK